MNKWTSHFLAWNTLPLSIPCFIIFSPLEILPICIEPSQILRLFIYLKFHERNVFLCLGRLMVSLSALMSEVGVSHHNKHNMLCIHSRNLFLLMFKYSEPDVRSHGTVSYWDRIKSYGSDPKFIMQSCAPLYFSSLERI